MSTDPDWQMYAYFMNKGITLEYLLNLSFEEKIVYKCAMDWGVNNKVDLDSYTTAYGINLALGGGKKNNNK